MTKPRLGRLSESGVYVSMLQCAPVAVGPHFALYYAKTRLSHGTDRAGGPVDAPLSTGGAPRLTPSVDNIPVRLGVVVPKRLCKRAVTRSLLKRQVRAATTRRLHHLKPGIWIVRQRNAFQSAVTGSAAFDGLKREARLELDRLLDMVRLDKQSFPCSDE